MDNQPISYQTPVNPMSADAMKFLYDLGAKNRDFVTAEIEGAMYVNTDKLVRVAKYEKASPDVFSIRTLSGLVDWLNADVDELFDKYGMLYAHVEDVDRVSILAPLAGEGNKRDVLATCHIKMPNIKFDTYLDPEDFSIMLQTRFNPDETRDNILALAGNLRMEQGADVADDGISQRVTVRKGIATMGDVTVKNPAFLAPLRTFHEVKQPKSPFVLRFQKKDGEGPGIALFEADGGAWKTEAIMAIGEWLERELAELDIKVIA